MRVLDLVLMLPAAVMEQTHACRRRYWRMPESSRADLACLIQSKQGK